MTKLQENYTQTAIQKLYNHFIKISDSCYYKAGEKEFAPIQMEVQATADAYERAARYVFDTFSQLGYEIKNQKTLISMQNEIDNREACKADSVEQLVFEND